MELIAQVAFVKRYRSVFERSAVYLFNDIVKLKFKIEKNLNRMCSSSAIFLSNDRQVFSKTRVIVFTTVEMECFKGNNEILCSKLF